MASTTQTIVIGGLPLPQDDLENIDPLAFQAHQANIIRGMRERVQNPPLGEFRMEALVWTYYVTNGKGKHKGSRLVVILWDRSEDFISG